MRILKSTVSATLSVAMGLVSVLPVATAEAKPKHHQHHQNYQYKQSYKHKHRHGRDVAAGAAAAAVILGTSAYYNCKKWKYRYQRTGNPYFLDRYYACKY